MYIDFIAILFAGNNRAIWPYGALDDLMYIVLENERFKDSLLVRPGTAANEHVYAEILTEFRLR